MEKIIFNPIESPENQPVKNKSKVPDPFNPKRDKNMKTVVKKIDTSTLFKMFLW